MATVALTKDTFEDTVQSNDVVLVDVFRDQILLFSQPGALPQPALEHLIRQVKELDMDDIRRRVAEEDAHAAS